MRVNVTRRMNDKASGAVFAAGIHLFNGPASLAFARDRHDVPNGDFGRSLHQGELLIAALAKLRAETSDDAGLARWAAILLQRTALDVPTQDLPGLMALARSIDPGALANVVAPGASGTAGGSSVVLLSSRAPAMFADVRDDGVLTAVTERPSVRPGPGATATAPRRRWRNDAVFGSREPGCRGGAALRR